MGFGGIIATGIMVIVLIVTGYLIVASLNYSVDSAIGVAGDGPGRRRQPAAYLPGTRRQGACCHVCRL